jgi:RNA polymerase sigma factor (sigma-70 family)
MSEEKTQSVVEKFFSKEYKKLVNYVRKNIEQRFFESSPEDIVQDVALSLMSRFDLDSQVENFAAYIYRSLRNKIIDIKRKDVKNISIEEQSSNPKFDSVMKSIPDESNTDENIFEHLDYTFLYEAIAKLKPDEQAIIMSTEFEGISFNELSDKWDIPVGTLLSRKHRALAKLYKLITNNNQTIKIKSYGNKRRLPAEQTLA